MTFKRFCYSSHIFYTKYTKNLIKFNESTYHSWNNSLGTSQHFSIENGLQNVWLNTNSNQSENEHSVNTVENSVRLTVLWRFSISTQYGTTLRTTQSSFDARALLVKPNNWSSAIKFVCTTAILIQIKWKQSSHNNFLPIIHLTR